MSKEISRFTPFVDARINFQQARAQHGLNNGTINAREQKKMQSGAKVFRGMMLGSKADDGVIDASERIALHKALNKGSQMIHHFKNN